MTMTLDALEAEVLQLTHADRMRLLERVVASLDADDARDRAWDEVAAERDAAIDAGRSEVIQGKPFLADLRARSK